MNDHHHFRELLGPHLLGLLEPDEERQLQRHLAGCRVCREDDAELRIVHHSIREATAPPRPELKARIMRRLPRRRRTILVISAAAILLLTLFLGGVYPALLRSQDAVAATASLSPTKQVPGANGEVRVEDAGANMQVRLKVSGLSSLQPNEYYELWFVKGDKRISCGGFAVDSEGRATVTMNAAKAAYVGYSYAVVTREKAGGDLRPSESRVLGGEIKKT
jgi:Anti-sigma-K factor rskA, C-terminal/Putative zinc-finger